jgi:beta-glucosidase
MIDNRRLEGSVSKRFASHVGFREPALSFGERADDLLRRLTDDEKIAMLHQRSPAVPRLGLAEFHTGTEGVHGATWRDFHGTGKTLPATVFPQPVGLAASWDPRLAHDVGRATAREIRALHDAHPLVSLNVWAPVVNLLRDPRWGRNEEGYSEDPLLTARLATAFCRGLSGADAGYPRGDDRPKPPRETGGGYLLTAPTLKHFLGYNNEDYRDLTSSSLRPRVLHEYDLPPFREPIEAGVATGVMPSYNLVNGRPAHVSPLLRVVRGWTGNELLICSDAWAPTNLVRTEHYFDDHPRAHAAALRAGLDSFTDQDSDGTTTTAIVTQALRLGVITMADVDRAVRRKLLIRLRLGEFDPDGGPFADAAAMDTPEHRELARDAARRCAVLLKNDGGLLPLTGQQKIALVGPLADTLYQDWYSPELPYRVTIADGIAATGSQVCVTEAAELVRTDLGDFDVFDWGDDVITLREAAGGKYLTFTEDGELRVAADRPDGWVVRETFHRTRLPGGDMLLRSLATGQAARLRWDVLADGIAEAADVARAADVAVVVVGNDPLIGAREPHDRNTLALPPSMDRLVREVVSANPRTVLVIMSSYPYVTPDAPAIVWTCHAGQETGHALADLLTGACSPLGRLPQTWDAADSVLPAALDYDIIKAGWTYQYSAAPARFPFGHGLTYTRFGYGPLRLTGSAAEVVTASLDITNAGDRDGTEVVQLYVSYPAPGQPRRRLCGFARVELAPGETKTARIEVPSARLALWDVAAGRMAVPPGVLEIGAGASCADIRQTATLTVPGDVCVRSGQLNAADFDDYENITLVDRTREDGTAVTPANTAGRGWLMFRSVYSERTVAAIFRVACASPGGGRVEVRTASPSASDTGGGGLVAGVAVPCTGDRYQWTDVTVPLALADGTGDLYLALDGPVRLDWFRLEQG